MLFNLKRLRERHGMTQQQLASVVGVSQQSINKYENHDVEPDLNTLMAIADVFQTSVDYLIGHSCEVDGCQTQHRLSDEETKLLNSYRLLSRKEKESIKLVIENYNK